MNRLQSLFLTPFLLLSIHTEQRCNENAQEIVVDIPLQSRPNEKPQIIIGSVANILAHVGRIVGNPHDKPNLGENVTGILANIINIALAAGKKDYKHRQELLSSIFDELHLDQEIREIIKLKVEEIQEESHTEDN